MDKHTCCKNKMQILCKNPIFYWKNKKTYKPILLVLSVHNFNLQGDCELKFPSFLLEVETLIVQQTTIKVTWVPDLRIAKRMTKIDKWDHSLVSQLDEF
jgi:hypothetical protein